MLQYVNTEISYFKRLKIDGTRILSQRGILSGITLNDKPDITPIFIIGMPRSGTTLIERLLAQHPSVTAGGEMPFIHLLINQDLKQRRDHALHFNSANLANNYITYAKGLGISTKYFTDKMPTNFRYVSHICSAFPKPRLFISTVKKLRPAFLSFQNIFLGKVTVLLMSKKNLENIITYMRA